MKISSDALFRYSKREWLEPALAEGKFRISPASAYKQMEGDKARQDDELVKSFTKPKEGAKVTHMKSGNIIPLKGDITFKSELKIDYYTLCFSTEYHNYLYDDFEGYDACLKINNPTEFSERFYRMADANFPGWLVWGSAMTYGGLSEHGTPFEKHLNYIFQLEWRCVLIPTEPIHSLEPKFIKLGDLSDIAEILTPASSIKSHL